MALMSKLMGAAVCLLIIGIYVLILFGLQKLCLDKLRSRALKYIIAMTAAYALLIAVFVLSQESEFIRLTLQNTYIIGRMPYSLIIILLPAASSIFYIGYFEKDKSPKDGWKKKKILILSVVANGILAVMLLLWANFLFAGHSFRELFIIMKDIYKYTDWRFFPAIIVVAILYVYIIKYDHFKHNKK